MPLRNNRQGPVKLSPRLYQRVRRRLFSLGSVPSPHSFQEQAWRILYQISLFTRASFEACKRILSGEFHTLEVYALYRLATHIEEPGKSRVKSLIGKALLFRNATVPKNNLPLHIPFLAHDKCRANLETWIRQLILQHKHVAIPLFLPTHRLRKQGFPKLWAKFYTTIEKWRDDGKCLTHKISLAAVKNYDPLQSNTYKKTGHVAINLDDVNLPSKLHIFANANANSTYFLSRSQYSNICSKSVTGVGWNIMDYHLNWLPRLCRRSPQNGSFIWMQLTTYPHLVFLFMLFNTFYIGFQRAMWFIIVIMNNFVWPYFVLSYIFKVPSIPGRIRNFLNNYPFSSWSASSYSTGFSHLPSRNASMGLPQKSHLAVWICLFETENRLAKRSDSD